MRKRDVLADAAYWFIDLITAADLDERWPEFERWLQMSGEHLFAYEQVQQGWSEGDQSLGYMPPRRSCPTHMSNILH